ncbi:hypothetical protein O181_030473 [Austropuccinia psidii MF-1]|uniref:Uncharacterized protein n=1 Tax=Austropuccinia psidii MF-1 TaxID=1389203 RepID=A0A9Q3CVK8_9BASI|nr:hypothetical protein [Austropuccinia psidii MF-1]
MEPFSVDLRFENMINPENIGDGLVAAVNAGNRLFANKSSSPPADPAPELLPSLSNDVSVDYNLELADALGLSPVEVGVQLVTLPTPVPKNSTCDSRFSSLALESRGNDDCLLLSPLNEDSDPFSKEIEQLLRAIVGQHSSDLPPNEALEGFSYFIRRTLMSFTSDNDWVDTIFQEGLELKNKRDLLREIAAIDTEPHHYPSKRTRKNSKSSKSRKRQKNVSLASINNTTDSKAKKTTSGADSIPGASQKETIPTVKLTVLEPAKANNIIKNDDKDSDIEIIGSNFPPDNISRLSSPALRKLTPSSSSSSRKVKSSKSDIITNSPHKKGSVKHAKRIPHSIPGKASFNR